MLFAAWRPCWIWLNCINMGWTNIRQVNRLGSLGWLHEPGRPLGGRNLHGFPVVFGVSATRLSERDNFYVNITRSYQVANVFLNQHLSMRGFRDVLSEFILHLTGFFQVMLSKVEGIGVDYQAVLLRVRADWGRLWAAFEDLWGVGQSSESNDYYSGDYILW